MSLGGMASVGFSHFQEVEGVVNHHSVTIAEKEEEGEVIAQVGEKVDSSLETLEKNLDSKRSLEMRQVNDVLTEMMSQIAAVQERQNSTEVLLGVLDKEQARQGFKIETHERSFRPLRSINSRFQRVPDSEPHHPLLPSLETSWEDRF